MQLCIVYFKTSMSVFSDLNDLSQATNLCTYCRVLNIVVVVVKELLN